MPSRSSSAWARSSERARLAAPRRVDEHEVVDEGQVAIGRRGAEEAGDGGAHGAVALVGLAATDRGGAHGRHEQTADDAQQRRLARAVGAAQHDALAGVGVHVGRQQQRRLVDRLADAVGAHLTRQSRDRAHPHPPFVGPPTATVCRPAGCAPSDPTELGATALPGRVPDSRAILDQGRAPIDRRAIRSPAVRAGETAGGQPWAPTGGPRRSATPVRPATATRPTADRDGGSGQQRGDESLGRVGRCLAVTAEPPVTLEAAAPLEPALPPDREEGRHRTQQTEHPLAHRPALVDPEQQGDEAEGDEDDAVHEPEDGDGEVGRARDVLEEHPEQQQRPGHHLRDGDPAIEGAGRHTGSPTVCRTTSEPPSCATHRAIANSARHATRI